MILAVAALLFQFTPAVPAMPTAAAAASNALKATVPPAPSTTSSANLPAAPQPSTSAAANGATPGVSSVSSSSGPSGPTTGSSVNPPAMLNLASRSGAIDTQGLSTIRIPDANAPKEQPRIAVETLPSRRAWMFLSVAQSGAAAFDAYSTRQALATGAHEVDPMMRPFAGSPGIYAAIQVGPVLLDFAARRMQRSQNGVLRHTWWVPQTVSTGIYLFSGVHNLRVANRP